MVSSLIYQTRFGLSPDAVIGGQTAIRIILVVCLNLLNECSITASAPSPTNSSKPLITAEKFPLMDGSTSAEPILAQIACDFLGLKCQWVEWIDEERRLSPDLSNYLKKPPDINASSTHQSYVNLIEGQVDLILVAREPSEDELLVSKASTINLK